MPARQLPPEFAAYTASLPAARAEVLTAVIDLVEEALPVGYGRVVDFGMPHWVVPLTSYSDTYNGHPLPVAALAAQKNHFSLYLHAVYATPAELETFRAVWRASGKKLDMGKSCVRFKTVEDLVPEAISGTIARTPPAELIAQYERSRAGG